MRVFYFRIRIQRVAEKFEVAESQGQGELVEMQLRLNDKVVLITGGAKGIGAACTQSLATEGAIACILGRNPNEANQLKSWASSSSLQVDSFDCELTDPESIQMAVSQVMGRYGRIDGVVNNAGVNDGIGLRASVEEFRQSLEKNLVHAFVVVQSCLDALIQSRGAIVNISSKCATTGQGGTSGYVAAKGGLNGLTREWALDLAVHGIRVNCVVPAEVMTPMYQRWIQTREDPDATLQAIQQSIPLEHRMTTAQEIADMVVFLLSSRSGHTTGQIVYVDGGYTHFDRTYSR
jgi:L-fucose dehydrogenase